MDLSEEEFAMWEMAEHVQSPSAVEIHVHVDVERGPTWVFGSKWFEARPKVDDRFAHLMYQFRLVELCSSKVGDTQQ